MQETSLVQVENDTSRKALDLERTHGETEQLSKEQDRMNKLMDERNALISRCESEIHKRNVIIERKQTQIDQMNKKIDQLRSSQDGVRFVGQNLVKTSLTKKKWCTHYLDYLDFGAIPAYYRNFIVAKRSACYVFIGIETFLFFLFCNFLFWI